MTLRRTLGLLLALAIPCATQYGRLYAQVAVVNDGFPGESTAESLRDLPAALQQFRPAIAVLFGGANDALNDKIVVIDRNEEQS